MIKTLLSARSFRISLLLSIAAAIYCAAWPGSGIVVEVWFDHPPRGINSYELASVLLAIALPLVSLNSIALAEHDAAGEARLPLIAHGLLLLVLPLAPFVAFYVRVRMDDAAELPHPGAMAGTLLVYSSAAAIAIRLLGPAVGALLFVGTYTAMVLAQHYFGASWLGGALSTATDWHTHEAMFLVVLCALVVTWRTRGTLRRRLLIRLEEK